MNARLRFSRAIDSVFKHLSVDGFYQRLGKDKQSVRLILRQPDPIFELNDRPIIVNAQRIDVRVSELALPRVGDHFFIDDNEYHIESEPTKDIHQLVWLIDVLPINESVSIQSQSNLRLRVK